jgi:hypothetical protein
MKFQARRFGLAVIKPLLLTTLIGYEWKVSFNASLAAGDRLLTSGDYCGQH